MTEIRFHFNVPDKLLYACRLLRKAYASGALVAVTAEPETLGKLDQLLWSFSATDFVPHCRIGEAAGQTAGRSVLLVDSPAVCTHHSVLVNLGLNVPAEFERFERFIEVVSDATDERLSGRIRWKHYMERGYSLQKYDVRSVDEAA